MANHYGTVVIPARVRRPRGKAKVETAVGVVERRVLAPLRDRTFFSLAELNLAIRELVTELNSRPFQKLEGSRRLLFEELDRPALRPLPADRYEFAEWRKARVNIDYHIEVDHNCYGVPHTLVRKEVEVRLTLGTVLEAVRRAGYWVAVTTAWGWAGGDLLTLPRVASARATATTAFTPS